MRSTRCRPYGHTIWQHFGNARRPSVTPNLVATVDDPGAWDPNDQTKVAYENTMKALQFELSQGDKFCPSQT